MNEADNFALKNVYSFMETNKKKTDFIIIKNVYIRITEK